MLTKFRNNLNTAYARYNLYLLPVFLIYYFLIYFLLPNRIFFSPYHHDDYANLTPSPILGAFSRPRPVSTLIISLLAFAGKDIYYLVLNFFAVLYPCLVFIFVFKFMGHKLTVFKATALAFLVFSSVSYVIAGKYTGLITNFTSCFFGVLTLLLFFLAKTERKPWLFLPGFLLYFLSALSKEDFILPVLILGAYFLLVERNREALLLMSGIIFIPGLVVIDSKIIATNPFIVGSDNISHPYFVSLNPKNLIDVFLQYFNFSFTSIPLLITFVILVVYALLFDRRLKVYFLLAIIISLCLPYLVLPNHVYRDYTFNWIPWIMSFLLLFIPVEGIFKDFRSTFRSPKKLVFLTFYPLTIFLIIFGLFQSQLLRNSTIEWYNAKASYNLNIINSLEKVRPQLASLTTVGVAGVTDFNPWLRSDGQYLEQIEHFSNSWIVFVKKDDLFFKDIIEPGDTPNPNKLVNILSVEQLPKYNSLFMLNFNEQGTLRQ